MSQPDPYQPPSASMDAGPEPVQGPPWLTVWTRPRSTIRAIVDVDPARGVIPLAAIYGFGVALSQLLQGKEAEELTLSGVFGLAALIGPIGGILYYYAYAAIVRMTGNLIGGRATIEEARAAIAWASVPNIVALPLIVAALLARGPAFLKPLAAAAPEPALALVVGFALSLNFWGFILTLKCLAEVHRFSALEAFASMLLALLFGFAVLAVVVLLGVAGGRFPVG